MQNICYSYPKTNRTTNVAEREFQAISKAIQDTNANQLALLKRCLIGRKGSVKQAAAEIGVDGRAAMRWQRIFILTVAKHLELIE